MTLETSKMCQEVEDTGLRGGICREKFVCCTQGYGIPGEEEHLGGSHFVTPSFGNSENTEQTGGTDPAKKGSEAKSSLMNVDCLVKYD